MKTRLLRVGEVKTDKEVYPRIHIDWVTCARYYNAMKSGAEFPPITVAKLGNQYILIDGAHRLKATKDNKQTHIQAEIVEGLDKKQIFIEAVKRNIGHGRQFSSQEVTKIAITLEAWEMSKEQISEIIRLPAEDIKPFIAKRMTRITETNEEIALKSPLKNLAGVDLATEPLQDRISGTSQMQLLDAVITLFKNKWMDTENQNVVSRIKKLKNLIDDYKL